MTRSPNAATTRSGATRRPPRWRHWLTRSLLFLPALALVGVGVAASAGLFGTDDRPADAPPPPLELGGVAWRSVDVEPSSTGDGFTINARVTDDRLEGEDADRTSPYVLWMLANGRYDDRPWTDSWRDESALGLAHDQYMPLIPTGEGDARRGLVVEGQFSPSIDGEISYDRIPAGEYTLRALVVRQGGSWDGSIATRRIVVE